ncbi:MAG: hexose kinase [Pseudomonadota bacterium]
MSRILTVTLNPALDVSTQTDTVDPDLKLRCCAPNRDPGGGGVNVSRAIANLGGQSTAMVALGGTTAKDYRDLLKAEGLTPLELGPQRDIRQSLTVTETSTGRQYRFVMPGAEWQTGDIDTALARITATARPGDLLVPSGSQPPGVPQDLFLKLNATLAPTGVRMILDTSGAALAAAAHAPRAPLALLRMDHHEAAELTGTPLPDALARAAAARQLIDRGAAECVAIAGGPDGTVIATAEGAWNCPAPKVPVVSRVGAGDSFVAALTLALHRGDPPSRACAWGVAAASAAVMTPDTRLCTRADTDRCYAQIQIQAL